MSELWLQNNMESTLRNTSLLGRGLKSAGWLGSNKKETLVLQGHGHTYYACMMMMRLASYY